jgi:DNA-binding NarL/FixJ family response regulator
MPTKSNGNKPNVSFIRVLVVEDNELFRELIHSILGKRPELQIIGEASNGLEAVQKAEELHPDLILMDIGLPSMNGIEAARQIGKLALKSKIVFLSQETSPDIVQGALSLGAMGYVAKASATCDLLAAVKAAVQGKQFISAALTGRILIDTN